MPSTALKGLTLRLKDIDQLMEAHAAREGTQRGRRFDVEGLNASVKKALRDLVDMRNHIAHGVLDVTVYKRDVTRYRSYVTGFAERVDEVVRRRVEEITDDGPPW